MISCRMERQQFPLENHYFCHAFEALFFGLEQSKGNETLLPHPTGERSLLIKPPFSQSHLVSVLEHIRSALL